MGFVETHGTYAPGFFRELRTWVRHGLKSQRTLELEEATPLLPDENPPRKETPLPFTQILVLLLLQLTEPIMSLSIGPYINQVCS